MDIRITGVRSLDQLSSDGRTRIVCQFDVTIKRAIALRNIMVSQRDGETWLWSANKQVGFFAGEFRDALAKAALDAHGRLVGA